MKTITSLLAATVLLAATTCFSEDLRIGLIGLDTSHVLAFTKTLNDPKDKNHWNKDGLLKEVARLYGAYVPPPYLGVGRTGDCDCADDFTCAEHRGGLVFRDHK